MTTLTRRNLLAASALFVLPRPLFALSGLDMGDTRIDMLSDGYLDLPLGGLFEGLSDADIARIRAEFEIAGDAIESPCSLTLMRRADRVVLFDIGAGPDFMPTAGKLLDAMDALGVAPGDVTDLVLTHAHPDHIWGLLDDFDEVIVPNAQIHMGQAEFDYWMDPETVNTIAAARTTFAVGAARRLDAIADQITFLSDGDEVLPGVEAVATPGHTPGHMAYIVHDGGGLVVLGDALTNAHLNFEQPERPSGSDHDPALGGATRARLLDRITADDLRIAGFHLPGGGLGRAERRTGGGYHFNAGE